LILTLLAETGLSDPPRINLLTGFLVSVRLGIGI
jgi:hypothetical protein